MGRRKKFSEKFMLMFNFFLKSYREKILMFSGSEEFNIEFDKDAPCAKTVFKLYENGHYTIKHNNGSRSFKTIVTRHPNVVYAVIKGKKSWGLWMKEWALGIAEGTFVKREITEEFESKNISIPKQLMSDFDFVIRKERLNYFK